MYWTYAYHMHDFFASFLTKLWTLPKRCHIKYCANSRATECHNDRSWKFDCHLVAFAIGMNPKYLCSYQVPSHVGSHSIFWAAGSFTAGCHKHIACCTAVLWQYASLPQKVEFRMAEVARTCRRAGEHSLDRQELLVLTDFLSKQVLGAWQCRSGSIICESTGFNSTPNIKRCRSVFLDPIASVTWKGPVKIFTNSEPTHCQGQRGVRQISILGSDLYDWNLKGGYWKQNLVSVSRCEMRTMSIFHIFFTFKRS